MRNNMPKPKDNRDLDFIELTVFEIAELLDDNDPHTAFDFIVDVKALDYAVLQVLTSLVNDGRIKDDDETLKNIGTSYMNGFIHGALFMKRKTENDALFNDSRDDLRRRLRDIGGS